MTKTDFTQSTSAAQKSICKCFPRLSNTSNDVSADLGNLRMESGPLQKLIQLVCACQDLLNGWHVPHKHEWFS